MLGEGNAGEDALILVGDTHEVGARSGCTSGHVRKWHDPRLHRILHGLLYLANG